MIYKNFLQLFAAALILATSACNLKGLTHTSDDLRQAAGGGSGLTQVKSDRDDASNGTTVSVPSGTLAVGVDISIEEGATVANDVNGAELGLPAGVEAQGPSVNIDATGELDESQIGQLEISLPYTPPTTLALADDERLVVMFQVRRPDGSVIVGFLPRSKFTLTDSHAVFKAVGFGNYQIALLPVVKTEEATAPAPAPILSKSEAETLPDWQLVDVVAALAANRTVRVKARVEGSVELAGCVVYFDRDQRLEWDASARVPAPDGYDFAPLGPDAYTASGRYLCVDRQGRTRVSPWSPPVSVPAENNTPAINTSLPVPGAAGAIATSALFENQVVLTWAYASDDETPAAALQYLVYRSNANNIRTVAEAEANGTPIGTYTANIRTLKVAGLTKATTYYFNVLVKDGRGFKRAYVSRSVTTPTQAPFNRAKGFSGPVRSLSAMPDASGKVYAAGSFLSYGDTASSSIVRLTATGGVDATFGVGGGPVGGGFVTAVDLGTGDLYLGGAFTSYRGNSAQHLVRINDDGTHDQVFNTSSGFDDSVHALAVSETASEGVYVGGPFTSYGGIPVAGLVRIKPDGTVDSIFSVGTGVNASPNVIATAKDGTGDIFVGGDFTNYNGATANYIARIHDSGAVVTGFATGTGFDGPVYAIVADGAGGAYVGGAFSNYNGTAAAHIVKLDSTGAIDTTFNYGGGFDGTVYALAVDASGDILVGGEFSTYKVSAANRAIRLNADGTADTGFAVADGFVGKVYSIAVASDASNDVYFAGDFVSYQGMGVDHLVRLNDNGSLDTGTAKGAGFDSDVLAIMSLEDGSGDVIMGGDFTRYNGAEHGRIIRLRQDGTSVATFVTGTGFDMKVKKLAPGGPGKIYAVGDFYNYNGTSASHIVRLNANGSIDTGFNYGTGFGGGAALTVVPDPAVAGRIYVGGAFSTYDSTTANRIVRLLPDGSIDPSFADGGADGFVYAIRPMPDGTIYVAGDFANYNGGTATRVVKLLGDGSTAPGFTTGGGFDGIVWTIELAPDNSGDVYFGGEFSTYDSNTSAKLARVNADGSLDAGFAIGAGFDGPVYCVKAAPGLPGIVYAVGDYLAFKGSTHRRIVRLTAAGAVDATFVKGDAFNEDARAVYVVEPAKDSSGDIYVGGSVTSYNGVTIDRAGRIKATGMAE